MIPRWAWVGGVALLVAAAGVPVPGQPGRAEELDSLSREGMDALGNGRYARAVERFERGVELSRKSGAARRELLFRNALGAALFRSLNFRGASEELQRARQLARELREPEAGAAVSLNLSSLFAHSIDLDGARLQLQEALAVIPLQSRYRAALQYQEAFLVLHNGEAGSGRALLESARSLAAAQADRNVESIALDALGLLSLAEGRADEAELRFLDSFRLRRLFRLQSASSSLRFLGRLHFARSEWSEAERLFGHAIEEWKRQPTGIPLWHTYFDRGVARARQENWRGALADYQTALEMLRLWRSDMLSASGAQATADVSIADLTAALVEAAQRIAEAGKPEPVQAIALLSLESGRASSLRAAHLEARARSSSLPPAYAEALLAFRQALTASWRRGDFSESPELRTARIRLSEAESSLPRAVRSTHGTAAPLMALAAARRRLGAGRLFLSYLIGEKESYRWALTSNGLAARRLPGRERLEIWVRRTRAALAASTGTPPEAALLSQALFGDLPAEAWNASMWLLSLDGPLFRAPFAALPVPAEPNRRLVERVALEVVPSLEFIEGTVEAPAGPWTMVADPVYNRADPRLPRPTSVRRQPLFTLTAVPRDAATVWQLPRLVGSGEESRRIAARWRTDGHAVRVRTGLDATPGNLAADMAGRPAVVHLATHLLAPPPASTAPVLLHRPLTGSRPGVAAPQDGVLLLGLNALGAPQMVGSTEISALTAPGALVVLSGCDGGSGPVLPGAGLWALARAWIAAGASSVVASLWPIPDHSGEFFERFYLAYDRLPRHRRGRAAEALREVQTEWLRRPETARQSALWASFFVLGKE